MKHEESKEQRKIFKWSVYMQRTYPELELLHSIPNGGKRDKITGAILKAEGCKAGVSDIHLPVPRGGYASLYIELKAPDAGNKKGSKAQQEWIALTKKYGNYACICTSANEAIDTIEKYINGELK